MTRRIAHVAIRGRVQGVGYRAWLHHQAELHGLEGWVRNRRDGAVEALLVGPSSAVESVLAACREGPRGSRVDQVEVSAEAPSGAAAEIKSGSFEVLATI